ncbi:hypothetical protein D3C85_1013070 [compost metagenome]
MLQHKLHSIYRNRKSEIFDTNIGVFHRINPDNFAFHIDQSTAAIPRVNRRIRLNQLVLRAHRAVQTADNTDRNRVAQSERNRRTNRCHGFPNFNIRRGCKCGWL